MSEFTLSSIIKENEIKENSPQLQVLPDHCLHIANSLQML